MSLPSANSSQLQLFINFLPVTHGAQARRSWRRWGWVGHTCFQFPGKFDGWNPKSVLVPKITSAKPGPWRWESRSAKCKEVRAGVLEKIQTPATVQFAQRISTFIKYCIGASQQRERVTQCCQWFSLSVHSSVFSNFSIINMCYLCKFLKN